MQLSIQMRLFYQEPTEHQTTSLFSRKRAILVECGRSPDFGWFRTPSHFECETVAVEFSELVKTVTVAGTAQAFHLIPF